MRWKHSCVRAQSFRASYKKQYFNSSLGKLLTMAHTYIKLIYPALTFPLKSSLVYELSSWWLCSGMSNQASPKSSSSFSLTSILLMDPSTFSFSGHKPHRFKTPYFSYTMHPTYHPVSAPCKIQLESRCFYSTPQLRTLSITSWVARRAS
jgi:hypothetical protein